MWHKMPYKPVDRPEREENWFCYYSPKRAATDPRALRKPISQIVNLNPEKKQELNQQEKKSFVRGQIRDTDSKYIKLAKSGGHKNLLDYQENEDKARSPVNYPTVEWYYDNDDLTADRECSTETSKEINPVPYKLAEWMTYEEFETNPSVYPGRTVKRSIIGFHNMSTWKREEMEKQMEEEKLRQKKVSQDTGRRKKKAKNKQTEGLVSTKSKLKLPDTSKRQFPGNSKFSGSSYAARWYHKWYVGAVNGISF